MEITVQELIELIRECSKSEKTKTSTRSSNCELCGTMHDRTYRRCWDNNKVVFTLEELDDGRTALNVFDKDEKFVQSEVIYYCPFCGRKL